MTFPILNTQHTVPLSVMLRHQSQCVANHGLPAHTLAERGGLDVFDVLAILQDCTVDDFPDMSARVALAAVMRHVERDVQFNPQHAYSRHS